MQAPQGETMSASTKDLRISPHVAKYMKSRGIPLPAGAPPRIMTPSPGSAEGAYFSPERVDQTIAAFRCMTHTQGKWAGKPLNPDPWQVAYILAPVFGWVRDDPDEGTVRIVRKLYVEVSRRNGKTTLSGGIALYLTAADQEPGAQVYAAATNERQARYLFDPVKLIAARSPKLSKYLTVGVSAITHKASGSKFAVVSSAADALHGASVHGAVVDELHVHKTPDLLEVLETGTGSRRQPLIAIITTADDGRTDSIYARRREYIEQLANEAFEDHATYGVVWAADKDAIDRGELDPFSEEAQRQANPGYGVSPSAAYLKNAANEAKNSPADLAKYLRLHLGIRTNQSERFITMDVWDANSGEISPDIDGRDAYGGMDLGKTSDLTSVCWVIPREGGQRFDVLWRHWLPQEALREFDKRTAGMGTTWVAEGLITLTPGNVADHSRIKADILKDLARFNVVDFAYDPYHATQLVTDLMEEGAPMSPMRQGYYTMSPALTEFARVLGQAKDEGEPRFIHGGNPLMRWQIDNLAVETDASGNVKPNKKERHRKIDGVVAAIMALDRALRHIDDETPSVYEERGLLIL